jgi:hypothetical protein
MFNIYCQALITLSETEIFCFKLNTFQTYLCIVVRIIGNNISIILFTPDDALVSAK